MTDTTYQPSSCLVFDAMDRLGIKANVLDLGIKPLDPKDAVIGEVFTLKGISGITEEQKKASRLFFEELMPGVIIVIETGDSFGVGHWGELMSYGAKMKGVKGVVVDGGCRDSAEVQKMKMPVFCKYTSPFESGDKYCIGAWQVEVKLPAMGGGEVTCRPGDYIVADNDGIILIPKSEYQNVVAMVEEINKREKNAIIDMQSGAKINEAFIKNGVV